MEKTSFKVNESTDMSYYRHSQVGAENRAISESLVKGRRKLVRSAKESIVIHMGK